MRRAGSRSNDRGLERQLLWPRLDQEGMEQSLEISEIRKKNQEASLVSRAPAHGVFPELIGVGATASRGVQAEEGSGHADAAGTDNGICFWVGETATCVMPSYAIYLPFQP